MNQDKLIYILEGRPSLLPEIVNAIKRDCKPFLKDVARSSKPAFMYRGTRKAPKEFFKKKPRIDRYPKDTPQEIQELLDDAFWYKFKIKPRSIGVFCTGKYSTAVDYGNVFMVFPIGKYDVIWSKFVEDLYSHLDGESLLNIDEVDEWELERTRDDWEYEYGDENSGHGEWEYEGDRKQGGASRETVAYEWAKERIKDEGWDRGTYENVEEAIDELAAEIEGDVEWIPAVDWEDWATEKETELLEDKKSTIMDIVGSYKKGDILNAIKSKNEIMLICKEYYMVSAKHERDLEKAWKILTNPRLNFNQLELPFKKR